MPLWMATIGYCTDWSANNGIDQPHLPFTITRIVSPSRDAESPSMKPPPNSRKMFGKNMSRVAAAQPVTLPPMARPSTRATVTYAVKKRIAVTLPQMMSCPVSARVLYRRSANCEVPNSANRSIASSA
ncbi:MAG TPA: hypothetical protein EYQ27_10435 [Gemmatimonadetes bacterium]|nr:hypothetical protein [Gemmatimonadota bacterium]